MREYTDCYVAFMDLLGFKELLGNANCEQIALVFDEMNKQYNLRENTIPLVPEESIHYKIMSDSVCIFIDSSIENSLVVLIAICAYFQIKMLRLDTPILVRGGISRGGIYSNEDIIFGPGLKEAYILENNLAKYPRVIIPFNIVDEYTKKIDKSLQILFENFLYKDFDGFCCINYFRLFTAWGYTDEDGKRVIDMIYGVMCTSTDNSIREKYLYLQDNLIPIINKRKEWDISRNKSQN